LLECGAEAQIGAASSEPEKALDAPKQFMVAPRNAAVPIETTLDAVKRALQQAPGSRVLSSDQKTGIVVVEVPEAGVDQVRNALGSGFMFDPNAELRF